MVAVTAGQVVGEQAPTGERHAHGAVHEAFDVKVIGNVGADIAHSLQVHLAGQHHTASTELIERVGGLVVGHTRLGGNMQFEVRGHLAGHHHYADIGDDERIHACVFELADVFAHGFDLVVTWQHIARHIHAGAALMGVARALLEVLKTQVFGGRAHAERFAAAVDGIGTIIDRSFQAAQVAGRRQHFRLLACGDSHRRIHHRNSVVVAV